MSPDRPKNPSSADPDDRDDPDDRGDRGDEVAAAPKPDLDTLRAVAGKVREKFSNKRWFCGVGITRDAGGPSLRLDVDPDFQDDDDIPDTFQGFELVVTPFSAHRPRPARHRSDDDATEAGPDEDSGRRTGRHR